MENQKSVKFQSVQIDLTSVYELDKYSYSIDLALKVLDKFLSNKFNLKSIDSFNIQLTVLSDPEIKEINKDHRQKDKTTDVLSFPMHDNIRNNVYDTFSADLLLGDLLISYDTCQRQASEHNISFDDEFIHLMIHGVLHLLGYDHEIDEDEAKLMFELEDELLTSASEIKKAP